MMVMMMVVMTMMVTNDNYNLRRHATGAAS
jgi:hypothetical protein